jgi:hypothetical protein
MIQKYGFLRATKVPCRAIRINKAARPIKPVIEAKLSNCLKPEWVSVSVIADAISNIPTIHIIALLVVVEKFIGNKKVFALGEDNQ